MRHTKNLFRAFFILLYTTKLYSGIEVMNSRLNYDKLFIGNAIFVADNKWPYAGFGGSDAIASAYTKITFGIDERALRLTPAHSTSIDISIQWRDAANVLHAINNVTLSVDYDPAKSLNLFTYQNTYVIQGAHQVIAVINDIYNSKGSLGPNPPVNLYLEAEQVTERYYPLSQLSTGSYHINHSVTDGNRLNIFWQQLEGAEEYDLEWTFVNDYNDAINTYTVNNIDFAFSNNATRVRTSDRHYSISLNYEHGYLLYRLRGIGKTFYNSKIYTITGEWTAPDPTGPAFTRSLSTLISNPTFFGANIHFFYHLDSPLDENKNLQYSATFAEEGKKKEVMSYFDGSLRNRQTVTRNTKDDQAIVGQTFYDNQGRPAVTTLPVPAYATGTTTPQTTLTYYEDFNISQTSGVEFNRQDFDADVSGVSCPPPSNGMDTQNGASRYYSSSNPDIEGSQAYVPDAKNYPFTQTVYMPDNTGRVRKQSGVGSDFKIGSGHETTNLYSVPLQQDLDELFGSEAGNAERYKKNTVIDPNGQISVSYLNKDGKVIATSLAGGTPASLNNISSAAVSKTKKYLSYSDPNYTDVNSFDGTSLVFNWPIVPNVSDTYSFTYSLTVPQYTDSCISPTFCYDCDYDLEITVRDECGGAVYTTSPGVVHVNGAVDYTCSLISFNQSSLSPTFQAYLTAGQQYYLEKKLSINAASMNNYSDHYTNPANNICLKAKSYFATKAMFIPDTLSCSMNCTLCAAQVNSFVATHSLTTDPNYLDDDHKQALLDKCNQACAPVSKCETEFKLMLGDVSPGGQYGQFTALGNYDAHDYPVSVYNADNKLPEGAGNLSSPPVLFNAFIVSLFTSFNSTLATQFTSCFSSLPDIETAYWRYPMFYNLKTHSFVPTYTAISQSQYHYYDDNAGLDLSKIYLIQLGSGGYSPEPLLSSSIKTDVNGSQYVYPEELKHLKDFVVNFKPSWSLSLVKDHPEWCYFEWCEDQTLQKDSPPSGTSYTYTSEGFDDYLRSIDTWSAAAGSSDFTLVPDSADLDDILSADPYFLGSGQGALAIGSGIYYPANYLRSLMLYKLNSVSTDAAGHTKNAKQIVNYMARYANQYGSSGPFPCTFGVATSTSFVTWLGSAEQDQILNKEWTTYRDYYLAIKAEVQAIGSHINAISKSDASHCGCYNGCIGNTAFDAFHLPADYDGFAREVAFSYSYGGGNFFGTALAGGYLQNSQPCNADKKIQYSGKQRRFISSNDMINSLGIEGSSPLEMGNTMLANGEYQMFLETGQCPMAIKLQSFLNDMSRLGVIQNGSTGTDLYMHPSFNNDLYQMVHGNLSTYMSYSLVSSQSGGSLTLSFQPATGSATCNIVFSDTLTWKNVVSFTNIQFTSSNSFNITAYVDYDGDPATPAVPRIVSGSSGCITSTCQFPASICSANQSARDFLALINSVYTTVKNNPGSLSSIFGSGYNLVDANSIEHVYFTPALDSALGVSGSSPYMYVDSPPSLSHSQFTMSLVDNATSVITSVELNSSGFNYLDSLVYFGNLVPDPFNSCHFTATAYCYTTSANTSVTPSLTIRSIRSFTVDGQLTYNCFPLGDCTSPVPQSCNTPGYLTMRDLGNFLTELKTKNPATISTPLNIDSYNYLSSNLKSPFGAPATLSVSSFSETSNLTIVLASNGQSCNIVLTGAPHWQDINSFHDFVADETNPGTFSCQVTYSNSYTALVTGTSCYQLANCDDCTQQTKIIFTEDFDRFNASNQPNVTVGADFVISDNSNYVLSSFGVQEYEYSQSPSMLGSSNTLGYPYGPAADAFHVTITNTNYVGIGPTTDNTEQHTPSYLSTATATEAVPGRQDMMEVFYTVNADFWATIYQKDVTVTPGNGSKIGFWYNNARSKASFRLEIVANNDTIARIIMPGDSTAGWKKLEGLYPVNTGSVITLQIRIQGRDHAVYGAATLLSNLLIDDIYVNSFNCQHPPLPPPVTTSLVNECEQQYHDVANHNLDLTYSYYLDSISKGFKSRYVNACKKTMESIYGSFQEQVSHHTLYYYDQAGNLVKTVPPAGVSTVDIDPGSTDGPANQTKINNDRLNGTQTLFTDHALASTYQYNSLNQLVKQQMPDHEAMDVFNVSPLTATTSGVTSSVTGTGLDFYAGGNNGLLVGNDTGGHGVIYTTADGGSTWKPASLTGTGDVTAVQKVGSANVFAVTSSGNLLRSTDDGSSWHSYNLTGDRLNSLAFFEDPNAAGRFIGMAVGNNSQVHFCKFPASGSATFSPVNLPGSITADIKLVKLAENIVSGLWVFILCSTNGLMMHSAGSYDYTQPPILKTLSSLFDNAFNINDFDLSIATDKLKGYIAGSTPTTTTGFACYAELGLTSDTGNLVKSFIFPNPPRALTSLARRFDSGGNTLLDEINVASDHGEIYYATYQPTLNIFLATANPTLAGGPAGTRINTIRFAEYYPVSSAIGIYAFGDNGTVYSAGSKTGSFTAVMNTSVALNGACITQPYSASYRIFMAGAGSGIYTVTPASPTGIANCLNITLPQLNDVSVAADNSGGSFIAGNSGLLLKGSQVNGGWQQVSTGTSDDMKSVYALTTDKAVIACAAGSLRLYNSGTITTCASSSYDFNRVWFSSSTNGYAVTSGGELYRTTNGAGTFSSSTIVSADLRDVHYFGSTGMVVGKIGTSGIIRYLNSVGSWTTPSSMPSVGPLNQVHVLDGTTAFAYGDAGVVLKSTDAGHTWSTLTTGTFSSNLNAVAFNGSSAQMVVATNSGSNTILLMNNQQGAFPSRFYYDQLGRLIISQNGKQFNKTPKAYSYTTYDALGRITQVGETGSSIDPKTLANYNSVISAASYTAWLAAGTKKEVTTTFYDQPVADSDMPQNNLRKRVSATYIDNDDNLKNGFIYMTAYSYDVHGNVSDILQADPELFDTFGEANSRIHYNYDLVSGKVNEVIYKPGAVDELRHRYEYDADNRITNVLTSRNGGVSWQQDAKYYYYKHGPLARTELGPNKTQGMDYAYTLQGWIKGMNSSILSGATDIGKDGITGTGFMSSQTDLHSYVAGDIAAYSLYYYTNGSSFDYQAIDNTKYSYASGSANSFDADPTSISVSGLYNGNIEAMQTTIAQVGSGTNDLIYTPAPQLTTYKYDQLNRINEMLSYSDNSGNILSNNTYGTITSNADAYHNLFTYDANGNILTQQRYDDSGTLKDDLTYQYDINTTTTKKRSNKLYHVNDAGSTDPGDINDQGSFSITNLSLDNYGFDEIGNLVKDNAEEIDNITWTVYGKLKTIIRSSSSTKPDLEFVYDSQGNRIQKIVKPKTAPGTLASSSDFITTYYVRDAQGNVMATYEGTGSNFKLMEQDLYGSSRLGLVSANATYSDLPAMYTPTSSSGSIFTNTILAGNVNYELVNHLLNVLTVISDRKLPVDADNDNVIERFVPDVLVTNDYAAFGGILSNRNYNSGNYKYSFQNKEQDNEVKGIGNSLDFGERMYDPRLGKFLSVDPLRQMYPWQSSYAYIRNNPIFFIDVNGEGDPLARMQIRQNSANNTQGIVRTQIKAGQRSNRVHQGFDLYAKIGTPVMAVKDAEVYKIVHDEKADYGKQITLKITNEKGETRYAQYSHLSEIDVKVGDKVTEGQEIGKTGKTGNARTMTGNDEHLHFEYRTEADPGLGLKGRLSPNDVLDTKFYPEKAGESTIRKGGVGVIKVDKDGNATKMEPLNKGGKETSLKDYTPTENDKK